MAVITSYARENTPAVDAVTVIKEDVNWEMMKNE